MVLDDFDVVAVGVEHERGVVAGVIARALTGLAVAAVSGSSRVGVEPGTSSSSPENATWTLGVGLIGDHEEEAP
jgi:hypothetical protein